MNFANHIQFPFFNIILNDRSSEGDLTPVVTIDEDFVVTIDGDQVVAD